MGDVDQRPGMGVESNDPFLEFPIANSLHAERLGMPPAIGLLRPSEEHPLGENHSTTPNLTVFDISLQVPQERLCPRLTNA